MPKLFKLFAVLISLFWCFSLIAQQKSVALTVDESPIQSTIMFTGEDAIWDLLLEFDASALSGAAGNAGAEWDGTSFYTTRWASTLIHEYSADGLTLIREFSIPGVSGLRDLAYDGTYFYGGASANTIYQMDFATNTLIGTIPTTEAVRHISYDSDMDAFWVGNWSTDIVLIDRTGTELARIPANPAVTSNYGSCYDNVSPGGPFLWVFSQGTGAGSPQMVNQLQLPGGTFTGVARDVLQDITGAAGSLSIAGGLFSMTDYAAGFFTIGGLLQGNPIGDMIFVYEIAPAGPPCPVGDPSDPSPTNGATGVPITGNTATWVNGTGATEIEVFFGGVSVYTGVPITSLSLAGVEPLDYSTSYSWKVNGSDGTCWTYGPTWSFTTMDNPGIANVFTEDFDGSWAGTWTITNNGGACDWVIQPDATARYTVPGGAGNMLTADSDLCGSGTTMNTTATMDLGVSMVGNTNGVLGFSHQFNFLGTTGEQGTVEYSIDGGATWTVIETFAADLSQEWESGPIPALDGQADVLFRFVYVAPGWDWWWVIDNVWFDAVVPVELTSFTANVGDGNVTLNWSTATETNNQGFDIERSSGNEFVKIGFVAGHGTSTEIHNYTYTDNSDLQGTYVYRLKQVDYDGTFEYSNAIEVDVTAPKVFALEQNYPNPFNPTTNINFNLAVDSKVSLTVFDILGQEVANLVSGNLAAGPHSIDFNATNVNSGVYFYRLNATGVDGTNFTAVKKMILTK